MQDPYRKFKGPEGYQRLDFVATSVTDPAVAITGMRMLDNSAAEIRWRLTGKLGPLPIDVAGARGGRAGGPRTAGSTVGLWCWVHAAALLRPGLQQPHTAPPPTMHVPTHTHNLRCRHDGDCHEPADGAHRAAQREVGPARLLAARSGGLERGTPGVGGQAGARSALAATMAGLLLLGPAALPF